MQISVTTSIKRVLRCKTSHFHVDEGSTTSGLHEKKVNLRLQGVSEASEKSRYSKPPCSVVVSLLLRNETPVRSNGFENSHLYHCQLLLTFRGRLHSFRDTVGKLIDSLRRIWEVEKRQ
jgi:hypothetical protein